MAAAAGRGARVQGLGQQRGPQARGRECGSASLAVAPSGIATCAGAATTTGAEELPFPAPDPESLLLAPAAAKAASSTACGGSNLLPAPCNGDSIVARLCSAATRSGGSRTRVCGFIELYSSSSSFHAGVEGKGGGGKREGRGGEERGGEERGGGGGEGGTKDRGERRERERKEKRLEKKERESRHQKKMKGGERKTPLSFTWRPYLVEEAPIMSTDAKFAP